MRKRILPGILSIALMLCAVAAVVSVTYAWLTPGEPVAFEADGSAVASYFGGGSGVEGDPYIISVRKHVYNLAWLQYLGTFNEMNAKGTALAQQYFFVLANDIDMNGQVIPPIGTKEHPFVGNFDGQGFTISNVTVANVVGGNDITERPPAVEEVHNGEIIGFFGVIGEYGEQKLVSNEQLGNLQVSNLILKDVTIRASTEQALAGLFAGFVNGTIQDIKVNSGTFFSAASNKSPFTDSTSFVSPSFTLNKDSVHSMYTLIGDYLTTKVTWTNITGPTTDVGQGSGFGGSIDMLSLAKRITYIATATGSKNETIDYESVWSVSSSGFNLYGAATAKAFNYTNAFQMFYLHDNTYMPLNIDTTKLTEDYYKNNSSEVALQTNTGYIVGKARKIGSGAAVTTRNIYFIMNSLGYTKSNYNSTSYGDGKSLQILTKTPKGQYYVIADAYNGLADNASGIHSVYSNKVQGAMTSSELGFTQYDDKVNNVRNKLGTVLTGSSTIHGVTLHNSITWDESGVLRQEVKLGNKTVPTLVKGAIQFDLSSSGVVTMVAGTFPNQDGFQNGTVGYSHYLPKLYKVNRKSNNEIDTLDFIETVHKHKTSGLISYNGEGVSGDGWELVYDYNAMSKLSDGTQGQFAYTASLFYFEIPVEKGEYALGGAGYATTYLVYLDIGGNAGTQGTPGEDGDDTPAAEPNRTISGVYFANETTGDVIKKYFSVSKTAPKSEGSISFDATTTDIYQNPSNMTATPKDMQEEETTSGGS